MGLVILPVAAVFLLVWLAVTGLIVALVAALLKGLPGRPIPQIIGGATVVALCWWLPNASGLHAQSKLDQINGDCGWTIAKKAPPVDGIYIEETQRAHLGGSDWLSRYYPRVQYRTGKGEVVELAGRKRETIPERTLRYGIRLDREQLPGGVDRFTRQVVDFDSNEVLATYAVYEHKSPRQDGIAAMAYGLLTVQPKGCPGLRFDEFESKVYEALPLAGAKQCQPGSYRSVDNLCCTWSGSTLTCGR